MKPREDDRDQLPLKLPKTQKVSISAGSGSPETNLIHKFPRPLFPQVTQTTRDAEDTAGAAPLKKVFDL